MTSPSLERSPTRAWLARAWSHGYTRVGIGIIAFVVAVAVLGPLMAPYTPTEFVGRPFAGPSGAALLGTDVLGRDVLSRVLSGGLLVLWMSLAATAVGMSLGVTLGMYAGYQQGGTDGFLMRSLDVVLAFPQLVLVLLFVSMLGPQLWLIVLLAGVAVTPGVARVARGATMEIAARDYVQSAQLLGQRKLRVMFGEILPGLSSPMLVEATMRLIWAIALIAALSFLGFGVQSPNADWGLMVNENRNGLSIQPLAVLVPVAMIGLFAVGAGLLAEGLSRAMALTSETRKST
jgi:peptide/nickel transport system permease protein